MSLGETGKRAWILLLAVGLLGLGACNDSEFAGQNGGGQDSKNPDPGETGNPTGGDPADGVDPEQDADGKKADDDKGNLKDGGDENRGTDITLEEGKAKAVAVVCPDDGGVDELSFKGKGRDVRLEGQICPRAYGNLNVMFIVDVSGSMAEADRGCARADAIERILDNIRQDKRDQDEVNISTLTFSDTASRASSFTSIEEFGSLSFLDRLGVCGARGSTNYSDAFRNAKTAFQGQDGNKVIYFISDGLPTAGGGGGPNGNLADHEAAGLNTAQTLQNDIKGVSINTVFLRNPNQQAQDDNRTPQQAKDYLVNLTGSEERVKFADRAADLADKIVELSIPSIKMTRNGLSASLSADGFGSQDVPIERFVKHADRDGTWVFETEPFQLYREDGQTVENTLTIEAEDVRGTVHETKLKLDHKG